MFAHGTTCRMLDNYANNAFNMYLKVLIKWADLQWPVVTLQLLVVKAVAAAECFIQIACGSPQAIPPLGGGKQFDKFD